jgi:hypothetical protein
MADKNVVDDYYSNIKSDEKTATQSNKAKPKIKPKRKIVVKKASEKKDDNAPAVKSGAKKVVKKVDKKPRPANKPAEKKQFVQKIEVVKKADLPTVKKPANNQGESKTKDTPNFNNASNESPVKTFSKKSKKPVVSKKADQEVNAKKIFGHKKTR